MDSSISWPGWNLVGLIGKGSFGVVYEIERDVFGKKEKAALKVISIPQSDSDVDELIAEGYDQASINARYQDFLEDIVREYSIMAEMKGNSNIVDCDDLRYEPHRQGVGWDIFIKMELLTPMMKTLGQSISEEEVIHLGRDICQALILCKQHNIVHRDIKPQNIFVSKYGAYKLGDFGIAKISDRTTSGTRTGTFKYMAPEVYNNQPYGASSDIYALGMVMYWMLNERRAPFLPLPPAVPSATIEEEAKRRRFRGERIPPPLHGSKELKRIVCKACEFQPKDRYESAAQMLEELNRLAAGSEETEDDDSTEGENDDTDRTEPIRKTKQPRTRKKEEESDSQPDPVPPEPPPNKEPEKKTKHKAAVLAVVGILAVVLIFAVISLGSGIFSRQETVAYPTEREMMSDATTLMRNSNITGSLTDLTVLSADENTAYQTYTCDCELTVHQGSSDRIYSAVLVYEKEDDAWVLSSFSKLTRIT